MVTRFDNWPTLLSDYFASRRATPPQWGHHDCLAFSAGAVEALTGFNFMANYPSYDNPVDARALLLANRGVVGIVSACLGQARDNIMLAARGDIAVVRMPTFTAGVVDDTGQNIALACKDGGIVRVPLDRAFRVWGY